MRKVIFQTLISLDGFYEGPGREIDWHNVDEEFNEYAVNFLNSVDTLMFGRITYELMASYWPTDIALKNDSFIAEKMNRMSKVVVSNSLEKADWSNTRLIKDNIVGEVVKLKLEQGKDIAIFGSSDLAVSLIPPQLIDEYSIMINPVILGNGKTLLRGLNERLKLNLLKTTTFKSGNVLLRYALSNR